MTIPEDAICDLEMVHRAERARFSHLAETDHLSAMKVVDASLDCIEDLLDRGPYWTWDESESVNTILLRHSYDLVPDDSLSAPRRRVEFDCTDCGAKQSRVMLSGPIVQSDPDALICDNCLLKFLM
jgi:hypothetical protein